MRKLLVCGLIALAAFLLGGCQTNQACSSQSSSSTQRWFLDPSAEFTNYRTYGFLQVTAVRYSDEREPMDPVGRREWKKNHRNDRAISVHHTDEIIWRTLQDEMQNKGFAQVAPEKADLWVIYYGGPRPIAPMSELRIKPTPFTAYFVQNELKKDSFFIDIIDAQRGTLLYRGWDNETFINRDPQPDRILRSVHNLTSFFPSRN